MAALFVVQRGFGAAKLRFEEHADQIYEQIQRWLMLSQSILHRFVAVLSLTRGDDYGDAGAYAGKMLTAYPYIYAIEVVRPVLNARCTRRNEGKTVSVKQGPLWPFLGLDQSCQGVIGKLWKMTLARQPTRKNHG